MKRFLLPVVAAAMIVGLYAACTDNQSVAPIPRGPSASPLFDVGSSSNGTGQCMFLDAKDAGYAQDKLQCVANDVDIGEADVNFYCIYNVGDPVCNPTTPLAAGDRISCIPGQHIVAKIDAVIQNSAKERFDMGLWILEPGLTGDANTGSSCKQYNLIPGQNGSVNIDGDQCGDVNATTTTINVPLDNMDLICPSNGQTTLSIQACAGWSNSTSGGNDVVCPIDPPGGTLGFRQGTTPAEGSKCKCNTLPLAIDVKGVLRVKKVTVPAGSSQSFDFTTTGTGYTTPFSLTDGQTNSSGPLSAGTYTAAETVPSGWDLTGRNCVNTADQSAHTFSNVSTNGVSVALASGDDVTCTFTNTQKPKLTVNKVCAPTTDDGHFNLLVDAATFGTGTNVACGGTTGAVISTIGSHTVSETAAGTTSLSDYTSVISGACDPTTGAVSLAAGDNKTCTITNTRKPKLTVNKVCAPTTDGGHFNLLVDAATFGTGTNVACGGTTGAVISTIGSHTVSETAAAGTSLSDYTSVISGACDPTTGAVSLAAGDNKTCTITNTRKGTLTVNKVCSPTTDAGHFNLLVDAAAFGTGTNVACGGTTGAVQVSFTTHTVSETAAAGTNLADYTTVISGACDPTTGAVTIAAGDAKVCTITNTRKPKLTVNKVCAPTTDAGHFNLLVDAATFGTGTNVACGGTTGAQFASIGSHTVSETAAAGTSLGDYSTVISGDCNATTGAVSLAAGDNKTCTITNRRLSTIIIEKEVVGGGTQSFTFTRTLSPSGADAGDNPSPTLQNGGSSSSGNKLVLGNYKVCETDLPVGWSDPTAAGYTLVYDAAANTFCATFALGWGETKTIHFVNTPPPGGGTRTIGYWKNWSSCAQSGGHQYDKFFTSKPEAFLDTYLGAGSSIYPIGSITSLTCQQAVNLLAKNAIDGTSRPGDPIYNMVAQLLGAKLNVAANAGTCAALNTALGQAQTLLLAVAFDGTLSYKGKNALTATQIATANSLNTILTSYNEGTLGGGCPTHI